MIIKTKTGVYINADHISTIRIRYYSGNDKYHIEATLNGTEKPIAIFADEDKKLVQVCAFDLAKHWAQSKGTNVVKVLPECDDKG